MEQQEHLPTESPTPPNANSALARSIRRLTIAVWCLVLLIAAGYILPWASFFFQYQTRQQNPPSSASSSATSPPDAPPYAESFDNSFHERSPEEKVKRATVILLTRIQRTPEEHKEVITEILKRKPGVTFYYNVGDEYGNLSHTPQPECTNCEGQGQVVFLIGNPARMASSYSFDGDRIDSLGGMSLDQLRQLAKRAEMPSKRE